MRALSADAAELFAGIFSASTDIGPSVEADPSTTAAEARATLLQRLDALGRRAMQAEGLDEADALGEVADMATDLAEAMAELDDSGAGGLAAMIAQMLPQAAAMEPAGAGVSTATDGATAAAAIDMFRSALMLVGRAVRALPQVAELGETGSQLRQSAGIPGLSELFGMERVAAEGEATDLLSGSPAAPVTPDPADVVEAAVDAAPEVGEAPLASGTGPDGAALVADGPATEATDEGLILPFMPMRGEAAAAGGADLLGRIAAVAAASVGAVGGGDGAGAGTSDNNRRRLTVEDVLSALSQGGASRQGQVASGVDTAARSDVAEPPRFAEVLTEQIRAAEISDGHTRIELNPRGLGALEVDVSTTDDGLLNVVVRAENPGVLNALKADRDLLAQALGNLGGGALDLQSFSQGSDQRGSDQRAAPSMIASAMESPAVASAGEVVAPADRIGGGRLDIVT
ncbi:flagellar hook-length control protein FliK [Pseudodonghicola sp.]|uniref:flagellar hook-length control protein FliK n=1 Tax=Pseudodonghicola sp. TaxID=1969463 RepID=UPI003A9795D5